MLRGGLSAAALLSLIAAGCGGSQSAAPNTPQAALPAGAPRPQTYGHGALPATATRVVEIHMADDLRFAPAEIGVHSGETVTFRITNTGKVFHELTIGGPAAQDLHDAQMASMDMMGTGEGMAMGSHKMPNDAGHKKYMKALAARIAELDAQAAANDSVHVPPGETRDLTWTFSGAKLPLFGCHVVGHWSAGMRGSFTLLG